MLRRLPLLLLVAAVGPACGGGRCPEGTALQRDDLPCVCGEETLQMLPSCGTITCDGETWALHEGECEDDSGDSG